MRGRFATARHGESKRTYDNGNHVGELEMKAGLPIRTVGDEADHLHRHDCANNGKQRQRPTWSPRDDCPDAAEHNAERGVSRQVGRRRAADDPAEGNLADQPCAGHAELDGREDAERNAQGQRGIGSDGPNGSERVDSRRPAPYRMQSVIDR